MVLPMGPVADGPSLVYYVGTGLFGKCYLENKHSKNLLLENTPFKNPNTKHNIKTEPLHPKLHFLKVHFSKVNFLNVQFRTSIFENDVQ